MPLSKNSPSIKSDVETSKVKKEAAFGSTYMHAGVPSSREFKAVAN